MYGDQELRERIQAFIQNEIADLHIGLAEGSGEISLLLEKFQSGDIGAIREGLEDLVTASNRQGYREGLIKMATDIIALIE